MSALCAGLIQGILPGLALIIFMALVPMFLKMINNLQGVYSHSMMDFEVGRKFFIFQVTLHPSPPARPCVRLRAHPTLGVESGRTT